MYTNPRSIESIQKSKEVLGVGVFDTQMLAGVAAVFCGVVFLVLLAIEAKRRLDAHKENLLYENAEAPSNAGSGQRSYRMPSGGWPTIDS